MSPRELQERDYILFVDTEGSDLIHPDLPLTAEEQPWPVRISCKLSGFDGLPRSFFDIRIRAAEGAMIKDGATAVHGITTREARMFGMQEKAALFAFSEFVRASTLIVGFGVAYDIMLIQSRIEKNGWDVTHIKRAGTKIIDVMCPGAQQICKLQPPFERWDQQFKWPNLEEAVKGVLGVDLQRGKHDSWEDMEWAERMFWALFKRDAIKERVLEPFWRPDAALG